MHRHSLFSTARRAIAGVVLVSLAACSGGGTGITPSPSQQQLFKQKINHIVVIYQENWGFDSLYGKFPGANGFSSAVNFSNQVDLKGAPVNALPQVYLSPTTPDTRFPATLPVAPFDETAYIGGTGGLTGDPNHNFYLQQAQIDGGKMDKYLAYDQTYNGVGGLTFGYIDATNLPEGKLAQQYALADNFAQSAFGGSFINNFWMACACTARIDPNSAPTKVESYDASGNPTAIGGKEGRMTGDGYVVNTSFTKQYPQLTGAPSSITIVSPQTQTTLGDELSAANVSWGWYSGGLTNALAGTPDPTFQPHHQPYLYFANYAPGTVGATHIQDESAFFSAIASNTLPQVSFLKPLGANNEHPGYTNVTQGQTYVANVVSQIQMSPIWKDTLIVIVYDEAGGHYDHVAPTPVDRFGPSTRVPAIFISPFIPPNTIDHTKYETVSILSTIEMRFGLSPLGTRDAAAAPILAPFNFNVRTPQAYARRPLGSVPYFPPKAAPKSAPGYEHHIDD